MVGGGINGAGIARDAAGRGLHVLLCEQNDLAQHTSSASTKLIHGGLRYLEYYEFKLVRKALQEREVLLRLAPHIISPLRFVMPHDTTQRPAWMIRTGLFLYDHLAKRQILPASSGISLRAHIAGEPLKNVFNKGFIYSDGWVDDARLVILNALDARERGACILTQTKCEKAWREGDIWRATLRNTPSEAIEISARALVNAAGPWAAQFAGSVTSAPNSHGLRLIKGSHIVVPRLFDHPYAYLFQNPDKRIIFAIPYEHDFTLIGTTDLDYQGDAHQVAIDSHEIDYLCEMANRYFSRQIEKKDVVWTYSGVRPLLDDSAQKAAAVTRDYLLECLGNQDKPGAPLLNVWGGKITTYRKLAEDAMDILLPRLALNKPAWTGKVPLPGGDLEEAGELVKQVDFDKFFTHFKQKYAWLPTELAQRYAHNYGTRAERFLKNAKGLSDLGEQLAPGLYVAEAVYLQEVEWASSADDILWRRTKRGLYCQAKHFSRVTEWFKERALREIK